MTTAAVWRRLDHLQPLLIGMLAALGLMTVYSADADWGRQIIWVVLGACAYAAATSLDYRRLQPLALGLYAGMLLLLLTVHLVGHTALGARRWLSVAGFPLEPSELSKLLLVVVLAAYLSRSDRVSWRTFGAALLLAAPPACLILTQPDLGTTIVIGFMILGILAVANTPTKWMVGLLLIGAGGAGAAVKLGVLSNYQVARFTVFADPSSDPQGAGYNVKQALVAIGSGGLTGKGLFKGTQTNGKFVPEQQTDFVFTVAGEELGFIGAGLLVVLLGLVLWRAVRIAVRAEDLFGTLVATGIVCWFTFQAFENIGMTLGIMPVTGVPLPFVSYGGSSMFANMMALGLLQNVHMRRYA